MKPEVSPFDVVEAEFVGAIGVGSDPTSLPLASAEVAFAGRSNVGKSSLINTLVQRRGLVRTSNTPGCTRQINFFSARARDDARFIFVDLPGYGFAKRSKAERSQWADLIEGYLTRRATLRSLVVLVDGRRGLEEEEDALLDFVTKKRRPGLGNVSPIIVTTKVDKLPSSQVAGAVRKIRDQSPHPVIAFSSVTRRGWPELWKALRQTVGVAAIPAEDPEMGSLPPGNSA